VGLLGLTAVMDCHLLNFTLYFALAVEDWPTERTLEECHRLCKMSSTTARKGCKMPPLLQIPFKFVVIDTLHMFLRIMGILFHQVHKL